MSVESFGIIESTLREGEQFVGASFSPQDKIRVAETLDRFGVEYIELTSPAASTQSYEDCRAIAGLGLRAKVVTHVRCRMPDAELAVQAGVYGIDVVVGTSSVLRQFSDGKDVPTIMRMARDVVSYIRGEGLEVRVSTEDSFRSDVDDIMSLYQQADALGVDRVGIADTVGIATPLQVHDLVSAVKNQVKCGIEFHGHNDSGCAIANAYCALEAGATHVDTSVLGIGERNGIASLGGLIARIYAIDRSLVTKYRLKMLPELDNMIAEMVGVDIPFNNYITGIASFTHKAGVYAKAVLNDPETYEILAPTDFGLRRYISTSHRLTGRGAVQARAEQLNLAISPDGLRAATNHAERLAEDKPLGLDDVDAILRSWISEHIDRNE